MTTAVITPAVTEAIEEIRATFEGAAVTVREDGEGGQYVRIDPVDLGPPYAQRTTWIGFRITAQYPYSDIYPLFVRHDLCRTDGHALGEGITMNHAFDGHPAVQVSRRSNHLNPATDTAALKVLKVLGWMASR
jgi:hypothetical protein